MSKSNLVSPNHLQQAAKDMMLDGREPTTLDDWNLCANFWAANISDGLEVAAVPVLGMLLGCPLSKQELIDIAQFQATRKLKQ